MLVSDLEYITVISKDKAVPLQLLALQGFHGVIGGFAGVNKTVVFWIENPCVPGSIPGRATITQQATPRVSKQLEALFYCLRKRSGCGRVVVDFKFCATPQYGCISRGT